jgi:hypothetical protein
MVTVCQANLFIYLALAVSLTYSTYAQAQQKLDSVMLNKVIVEDNIGCAFLKRRD